MTKDIIHVLPTGGFDIVYVRSAFDAGLAGLAEERVSLWGAEELARLRAQLGAGHPVSQRWSWVAENFNYFSNGDIVVASRERNPLLASPAAATQAHREWREFYLDSSVAAALRERASLDLDKARQQGALLLSTVMNPIPVEAFGDYVGTRFLFGEKAKEYGVWLQEQGIESVPFIVADAGYVKDGKHESRAFGRGLWVKGLSSSSGLSGYSSDLLNDLGHVGGVRPFARAASALEERVER